MASPPELPRGLTPYVVDLSISRQEFERRIMSETDEIGAAFDGGGGLVVRPRRGDTQEVEFFDGELASLIDSIVVHNHPLGGVPSTTDGGFAAERNLAELRIVLPNGLVYSLRRPESGWPPPDMMEETMERSTIALRTEGGARTRRGLPPFDKSEAQEFIFRERRKDLSAIGVRMMKENVWMQ